MVVWEDFSRLRIRFNWILFCWMISSYWSSCSGGGEDRDGGICGGGGMGAGEMMGVRMGVVSWMGSSSCVI